MILSPKQSFQLQKALSEKIDEEGAKTFCVRAKVNTAGVKFGQGAWEVWDGILKIVLTDRDLALALLDKILVEHADVEIFQTFYNEILSSRQVRLNKLAEALKKGKCVVFLGPDALKVRHNNNLFSFNEILAEELADRMGKDYIYFDKGLSGNVSYLAQCYADYPLLSEGDVAELAAKKYKSFLDQGLVDNAIHAELAKLPLRLVINANPDDLLCQELNAVNENTCLLKFYNISNSADAGEEDSADALTAETAPKVLQYNIFGIFTNEDSILYTESQFLDFINNVILGNPKLDEDVLRELEHQENYLFLGFDFEQWYFKVLFQLFKIKKVDYASTSCGLNQPGPDGGRQRQGISSYNREFFEQEFKMFFVNDDIKKFLFELRNTLKTIK